MFNLLSGEFYKWKKSKSFKICLLSAIAMIIFVCMMFMMVEKIQSGELENGTGGVVVSQENQQVAILDEIGILDIVREYTGFGSIFYVIFVCIWIVSEYSNGAVKNIAGKGHSRAKVFLSKYLSALISVVIMNIICYAVTLLIGSIVVGTEEINDVFFCDFFSYIGMQLMFSVALTGIIVTICELVRNMGAGIAISIGIIMLSSMISRGLDMLFHLLHMERKATSYWIMDIMAECPMGAINMDFLGRGISVAVIWTALSLVLGMVHFQRADIK